jgi:hypothetical protein
MTTQEIWKSQTIEVPRVSIDYARHLSERLVFETTWRRRRTILAMSLASICMLIGAFTHMRGLPLMQACYVYGALATVIEIFRCARQYSTSLAPEQAGILDSLQFYRRELEKLRDAPAAALRFSMLLGLPALGFFAASLVYERAPLDSNAWLALAGTTLVVTGIWVAACKLRRRKFEREIAAVNLLLPQQ